MREMSGIDVGGVGHEPEGLAAPEMLGAPVPALPAVRVAHLDGGAAQEVQKLDLASVRPVHDLGLAVPVAPGRTRPQGPYLSMTRLSSPTMMSRASSQEIRT